MPSYSHTARWLRGPWSPAAGMVGNAPSGSRRTLARPSVLGDEQRARVARVGREGQMARLYPLPRLGQQGAGAQTSRTPRIPADGCCRRPPFAWRASGWGVPAAGPQAPSPLLFTIVTRDSHPLLGSDPGNKTSWGMACSPVRLRNQQEGSSRHPQTSRNRGHF